MIDEAENTQNQQALSHLYGRSYGATSLYEPNKGKEPIKLHLHINNYATELGKLRQN